jgi:hypothetical protein
MNVLMNVIRYYTQLSNAGREALFSKAYTHACDFPPVYTPWAALHTAQQDVLRPFILKALKPDLFSKLETDGKLVLFVNSELPPDNEIPLDYYRYCQDGQDISFQRLYRLEYVQDGQITHSLLNWRPVEVKSHCQQALKQLVDSMKGAKEFLE